VKEKWSANNRQKEGRRYSVGGAQEERWPLHERRVSREEQPRVEGDKGKQHN